MLCILDVSRLVPSHGVNWGKGAFVTSLRCAKRRRGFFVAELSIYLETLAEEFRMQGGGVSAEKGRGNSVLQGSGLLSPTGAGFCKLNPRLGP